MVTDNRILENITNGGTLINRTLTPNNVQIDRGAVGGPGNLPPMHQSGRNPFYIDPATMVNIPDLYSRGLAQETARGRMERERDVDREEIRRIEHIVRSVYVDEIKIQVKRFIKENVEMKVEVENERDQLAIKVALVDSRTGEELISGDDFIDLE